MKICVFDIEANGLNPTVIHCLVAAIYTNGQWVQKTTTNYDQMRKFFEGCDVVIGHNIMRWDIPVVERLLGIKVSCKIIDTLGLSWYIYPEGVDGKQKHGLEDWGEHFNVPKPKITEGEWLGPLKEETQEDFINKMKHRCQEDVKINCALWDKQRKDLHRIYEDVEGEKKLIDYIMFKLHCARLAEDSRWKLDVDRCKKALDELSSEKEAKVRELAEAMPKVVKTRTVNKPDTMYLKGKTYRKPSTYFKVDGTLSKAGERFNKACKSQGLDPEKTNKVYVPSKELSTRALKWLEAVKSLGLKEDYEGDVEVEDSIEDGNPNSHDQVKDWLFGLGWKPVNFNYSVKKDKDGKEYTDEIPQIRVDGKDGKELCPSVKKLFKVEPKLEVMEGLSVLTHRIGILKGYLSNVDDDGYLQARISGLTNTLRFKHSVIVNLPSASKPYGEIVRGVLIAPEGYELCGSDMSSLEDRTKQHYMWEYDPDYVKEMQVPDFDPHLALAEFAGALTPEQVKEHKNKEKDWGVIRHLYKTANYSCTYGAGGKKLALTLDISEKEGYDIVNAYRNKNWAIRAIEQDQTIKFFYKLPSGDVTYKVYKGSDLIPTDSDSKKARKAKYNLSNKAESLWVWNPVSKLWYSLRFPKDIFSTLNQGTGVWCFDLWIKKFLEKRPQLTGQMHDEVILTIKKGHRDQCSKLLRDSINQVNEELKLNREMDIDIQYGDNYAQIH